jgi:lactobin A/cerein 7B family class IIb bacteriocin
MTAMVMDVRDLTGEELEYVSGGIAPVVVVAALALAGVVVSFVAS